MNISRKLDVANWEADRSLTSRASDGVLIGEEVIFSMSQRSWTSENCNPKTRKKMRWVNGERFMEIDRALSTDDGDVWHIETNLNFDELPVEFRALIPISDEEGLDRLRDTVSNWAKRNGYKLASSDRN